jgi:hypothetical protein
MPKIGKLHVFTETTLHVLMYNQMSVHKLLWACGFMLVLLHVPIRNSETGEILN